MSKHNVVGMCGRVGFHMLFLDGVYVERGNGLRFRWVREPTSAELTQLTHTIAQRTACFLERRGLLERDAEQAYLSAEAADEDPMESLLGPAITYREPPTSCSSPWTSSPGPE